MDGSQATAGLKQHLIDPEICIRCNTCEATCPIGAITHDDNNYVVDAGTCNHCMDCVSPCPTGAIDNWFQVGAPFSIEEQFSWQELPPRPALAEPAVDALDEEAAALLADAHKGAGGAARAPASASKPRVNLFNRAGPATAKVTGNIRVTKAGTGSDVHHIILDFGTVPFPVLEGQSIGIVPSGTDANGRPHAMRLYSICSARDGERPNTNNLALTVKRVAEPQPDGSVFRGIASNYLCDLALGDTVEVIGPFGATFLMPDDPEADILMLCTGTGAAPFRAFTERRRRLGTQGRGRLHLFFGARTPQELPYFGPLQKVPAAVLSQHLVFSRLPEAPKEYVQDRLRAQAEEVAALLRKPTTHIYVCGLRGLETGVEEAFAAIGREHGIDWHALRAGMREQGRYHVETY
ncbi:benzoyl-CoA 2,3-epoxidase subunit BoxA [Paracraurococcus lichenis]|uniref:Benzoyl-CoA 2,3-epoxidase subunit BoxA n=1 Tax=Paracraurococcus lichenis TaxID=3064888 RepID=A0ABT9DW34_9PROT|nr:benzoyl-CoA 2,3-epoxidase subunit BoxA [Paracraurococcus sp. LOR1-02]MDO9708113.1 benzoyl-CoA 2,3-epoxidase subunit BoxA [Paracraurococcus sp. LOR1-02]